MNAKRNLATVAAAVALCGCQTLVADEERPARIVDADDASRAALQAAVNEAFGREVMLADTALTDSSQLVIEITPPSTIENPVPVGLDLSKPFRFQLVKSGDDCILVSLQDESRRALANTRCEAE